MSENIVRKNIEQSKKFNTLEARPDFNGSCVIFHPIPDNMQSKVKADELWEGYYKQLWNKGKKDKEGKPIYYQYFIPVKKISKKVKVEE